MTELVLNFRLRVEVEAEGDDAEVKLELVEPLPSPEGKEIDGQVRPGIARMIDEDSPAGLEVFRHAYVERCLHELGVEARPPSTGGRRYVNLFPPRRFGSRRVSAFAPNSGRLEIYADPRNAAKFEHAEVVENKGIPFAVKIYLTSDEAVSQAVELTRIAINER